MKIIDLSVCIENHSISEEVPAKIKYVDHKRGGTLLGLGILWSGSSILKKLFHFLSGWFRRKRLKASDFPDGQGLATETVTLTTHTGTHLDAPYHYGSQNADMSKIPMETFYGDGVLLDFSNRSSKQAISRQEIIEKLNSIGYQFKKGDIVLICTGAYHLFGTPEYKTDYVGLSVDSLSYILDAGVKMIGTDAFGLDQPFHLMYEKYQQTNDNKELWPAHLYGRKHPYVMMEKLTNLQNIGMTHGFKIAAFPVNIKGASAGWARVAAILPNMEG